MLIACPNCTTTYEIEPSSLGRAGRSVRCVRCQHTWFATNPGVLSAVAEAFREDLAAPPPGQPAPPAVPAVTEMESPPTVGEQPEPAALEPSSTESEVAAALLPAELPVGEPPAPLLPSGPLTVADAPAIVPTHPGEPVPPAAPRAPETAPANVESVAARRLRHRPMRRRRQSPPLGWTSAILSLLALNAGLVAWRTEVVRWLPQTAALYSAVGLPVNLRGLAFVDVATETETQDGVTVLVIEGTIVSNVARAVEVPRLRFAVRNERGQEIYTWTGQPPKSVLAPRASVTFRSRLASPPPEGRHVLVRFHNRRDTQVQ